MKRKEISASKYNKIMEKVIAKGMSVSDTLIEMLYTASKYDIIDDKKGRKK